jgi:hypothetical protein
MKSHEVICRDKYRVIDKMDDEIITTKERLAIILDTRYQLPDGRVLFVSNGLGGSSYMTMYCTKSSYHRYKSKLLPIRMSKKLAQVDLNTFAKTRNLSCVNELPQKDY